MLRGILRGAAVTVTAAAVVTFGLPSEKNIAYAAEEEERKPGGGYAATGQIEGVSYTAVLYNASNGLPTSDANCILATRDGYLWIGGYSGIIRFDGTNFERQDAAKGLANGKALFEDSTGRLWVGTNDAGFVVLHDGTSVRYTYKDGLPAAAVHAFAEGTEENVYVGTANGVIYMDRSMTLHHINDERINGEYIVRMSSDSDGRVYGNTKAGAVFCIDGGGIKSVINGQEIGIGLITCVFADPFAPGMLYLGTDTGKVYHGSFDKNFADRTEAEAFTGGTVSYISYACGRIWFVSSEEIGYLDENGHFHKLEDIPFTSSIETMTEDYQGNLWFTSSRQGVMKIVTNNFRNLTYLAGLTAEVTNSTCLNGGLLYVGTDKGLRILDEQYEPVENELTEYIGNSRIRCIVRDSDGNLWISTYTNGLGLICYTSDQKIVSFTERDGLASNGTR